MKTPTRLIDIPEHLRQFDWYAPHLKWLRVLDGKSVNAARAGLSGADLSRADLSKADLRWADLSEADLRWADLIGVDLSGAYGIVSFGPVGSQGRIGYIVQCDTEPVVLLGCWWGTLSATIAKLKADRSPGYVAIVEAAALVLSERKQKENTNENTNKTN